MYTKPDDLGVVNYTGLHVCEYQRQKVYSMGMKLKYLVDSGNTFRFRNIEMTSFRKMDI